ncbi:MAG: transcriptional regulator [Spirochaetota bacterium]|nr:transcriptional regulator [Spirochaetota bacterium]
MAEIQIQNENEVAGFLYNLEIYTDTDLEKMVDYAESLADRLDNGDSKIEPLFDYVTEKIVKYEKKTSVSPEVSGSQVLRFLMEQHNHKLKDLADIAPKSVWSEILNGKRQLNKNHIEKLSAKYHVSPVVFFNYK